nr:rod shape-determining protein RodA [Colwellia sp.]
MHSRGQDQQKIRSIWQKLHIDLPLLLGILALMALGLFIVYSASGQNMSMIYRHVRSISIALIIMLIIAQIPPMFYQKWAVPAFVLGVLMLVAVLLFGHVGKGAQRWLDLGVMKFQPSEIMKVFVPIMIAWYISQDSLPVKTSTIIIAFILVLIPTLLIAKQPDLGTSLLIASSGIFVIFLAGASWKLIAICAGLVSAFAPILWFFLMKDYQKQRVMTFLNPEQDPLGSGYHIIQSKIAIGSGGFEGKGYLQGTQSQLEFLPERHTDFIFSVFSEEFGLIGVGVLLSVYLFIIMR